MKNNIEKFYQKRISDLDLKSSEDKIIESFENYLRVKFLNFKNESQIEKKLKSYKKDLNEQFKNKISELEDLMLNQEKFNSLVSELIKGMSLDEKFDEEEKREEENNNQDKHPKNQNEEKNQRKKRKKTKKCQLIAVFLT